MRKLLKNLKNWWTYTTHTGTELQNQLLEELVNKTEELEKRIEELENSRRNSLG